MSTDSTTGCSAGRGRRRVWLVLLSAVAATGGLLASALPSGAANALGGNFEIDTDANLLDGDGAGANIDWLKADKTLTTNVMVVPDSPSGAGDESFGQGTKEDTAVPTVTDGSIPPNKSDLKAFGLYIEAARYLNLFWTRVQDPDGTTNMDFEFNQGTALSSNGVTPLRTTGDFLVTYDLSRGGTRPTISVRKWLASEEWGPATAISEQDPVEALGSINTSSIAAADADGVGPLSPRTFGEASIDLEAVFGNSCGRIGAAYLKSRSSDSFTSAVKDFVPPNLNINFNNCPPAAPTTTKRVYLSDEGTVGSLGYPGTLSFALFFKPATNVTATPACDPSFAVTLPASYANIAVAANGFAATPTSSVSDLYQATASGTYSWIVSYAPGGGSQLLAGSSTCSSEQVVVGL